VKARVIGLVGKYYPTGRHKWARRSLSGAAPSSGEFDPEKHKAACRPRAIIVAAARSIAPCWTARPSHSATRHVAGSFELAEGEIGARIIATPGCESNVKEIYDKCWELKRDPTNVIFNQV